MKEEQIFSTHMEDLARRAQDTGMAHSRFLSPAQAAEVRQAYQNRKDVRLVLEGGFAGAERCVAVFLQPEWGSYEPEELLAGIRLDYRPQDELRHPDILGAALGLGLSREVLGDITVEPGQAHLACLASMGGFLAAELVKAGRVGVKAARIPLAALPGCEETLAERRETVASLRLDAVVAAAFRLSRGDACEMIRAGKVQLAHREVLDVAKTVQPGDILSLRGKGRVKLLEAQGQTRKGRLPVLLGFYS